MHRMQEGLQTGDVGEEPTEIQEPRMNLRGFRVDRATSIKLAIALALLVIDQAVKWYAVLQQPQLKLGPVEFTLFLNDGIVFSLPVPQWVYLPVAIIVLLLFVGALANAIRKHLPTIFGLALVVLGALSNLIDRFAQHATVDYLVFFERSAVNLADGMILLGVLLFIRAQKKAKPTT